MSSIATDVAEQPKALERGIDWTGAFWVASGVPPLVLFSIGAVAAGVGNLSWLVWTASIAMGFVQSFTYAEIAGLFPDKSGGTSVYGAIAWVRYGKLIAPISVWCNWFAWSPVQAIGSGLAAGYILNGLFAPDSVINTWQLTLLDLSAVTHGLTLRINSVFVLGAVILVVVKLIQDGGILRSANTTKIIGISAMIPLILIGVVPLITGDIVKDHFFPLVPLVHAANGTVSNGMWDAAGWTAVAGAMFLAAWSTYGFETAVCYTGEFKDPKTDTFKAIFYSGLLCLVLFILVPITFQGYLGLEGMLAGDIVAGTGVAHAMGAMVAGGSEIISTLFVILMIAALILIIVTAMAGSSRTLYQGSVDGWLPRYLSRVNHNGAPTAAMWTDLTFNLVLLSIASTDATAYSFILAVSNCGYIIFNFLNLNAGWIHRIDSGHIERPYKAPTIILALGGIFAFVNAMFMGAGAKVWNADALLYGFIAAALIIPVFAFRHYVQDKGQFPPQMLSDLGLKAGDLGQKKAGVLPYLALAGGVAVVLISNWIFNLG